MEDTMIFMVLVVAIVALVQLIVTVLLASPYFAAILVAMHAFSWLNEALSSVGSEVLIYRDAIHHGIALFNGIIPLI